jgi:hypothetical protein
LRLVILLACFLLPPGHAQASGAQYQGLFLVGRFGEVCTMCEVVVLCERTSPARSLTDIPTTGAFNLYHFETRTF